MDYFKIISAILFIADALMCLMLLLVNLPIPEEIRHVPDKCT